MHKNVKQRLEMYHLSIPFFQGFVDKLLQNKIWIPLGPQSYVFRVTIDLYNVFPPFFHPSHSKPWTTILQPTCFVNVSHLHPTMFSLFSIKEHILHCTLWIIRSSTTKPFAHGNFTSHYARNFLMLSWNVSPFFPLPPTWSFCFFLRGSNRGFD
jgi:hypothetical protein